MINKTNNATKDKNTTNYDLVSNKEPNEKIEKDEEDNDINDEAIIPEFESVSMLGASMMSLRKKSTSHQARNLSLKPSNQTENTNNELNQEKIFDIIPRFIACFDFNFYIINYDYSY